MPAPSPPRQTTTPVQDGLRRIRSALISARSLGGMVDKSRRFVEFLDQGRGGVAGGFLLLLKTEQARHVLEAMNMFVTGDDGKVFERFDKWISVAASCGGAVVSFFATPITGGASAVLGAIQVVGCIKSVADLVYHYRHGKSLFESGSLKAFSVGIDAITTFGSIAGAGLKAGAVGIRGISQAILRRGSVAVSRWDQADAALQVSSLGLSGVDAVVELTTDQTIIRPPTYDNVASVLRQSGFSPYGKSAVERRPPLR